MAGMVQGPFPTVTLVANSASTPLTIIDMAAKGAITAIEVGLPVSGTREQTANAEFATSVDVANESRQHAWTLGSRDNVLAG